MHGKSLFLNRAVSRTRDWQCRYPALSTASRDPSSLSTGRQVVAAVADSAGIRCVFFTNHGSILDFAASWDEIERAGTWWHFAQRWNFWLLDSNESLDQIRVHGGSIDHVATIGDFDVQRTEDVQFIAFLDCTEMRARSLVGIAPIVLSAEALAA